MSTNPTDDIGGWLSGPMVTDEAGEPAPRHYSYAPVWLVQDVIAVLARYGIVVEMSAAERIRKPRKAARRLLNALHVQDKSLPKDLKYLPLR